jgi:hypothetical protein
MTQHQSRQPQPRDREDSIHDFQTARSRNDSEIYRRLSAVEQWQAEHRGTCTERHEVRQEWQRRTDADIAKLEEGLVNLKIKLALIAGSAAAGGGAIGGLIASLFKGLT